MTEAEARELEARWGAPGPAPDDAWRLCYRCGQWWPDEARLWCLPHRLCRACKNDEKRGIWPYRRTWHRKNRWGADGRLLRRCSGCLRWKPLTSYYLYVKRDKPRTVGAFPVAACIRCMIRKKSRKLTYAQLRQEIAA